MNQLDIGMKWEKMNTHIGKNLFTQSNIYHMKYIRSYNSYRNSQKINEEFVGGMVKGALSKLFQLFSAPFKDLVNDIKNSFKEEDPNSIKNVVMTNLNQAIDGAQKGIKGSGITVDTIPNIMTQFIVSLTDLGKNIGKDFASAIADKPKASGAAEVAKAILIGNEDAGWKGIVGLLNDPNYKYSKPKYDQALAAAANNKSPDDPATLKLKQNAAFTFFDNFQKDITIQLDKELSAEEMTAIYDKAVKSGGGSAAKFDYAKIKEFFDKKTVLKYKRQGYDDNKKPEDQPNQVGQYPISEEPDEKSGMVKFMGQNDVSFEKKYSDIIGPVGDEKSDLNKEVTDNLKKLASEPKDIELVKKVTDAIPDPVKRKKIENALAEETPTAE